LHYAKLQSIAEEVKMDSADKRTPAQPATQIELPYFEFRVPETQDAATAFGPKESLRL
jgi:hypothetical protein